MKDNVWGKKERNQRHPALTLQNKSKQEDLILTTDFGVLWTARILFPIENFMHLTSPLSSILWRNNITCWLWQMLLNCWHHIRYLKATLLLSSGPFTMTPVAPPERTANTYRQDKMFLFDYNVFIYKKIWKAPRLTSSDVNGIKWEKESITIFHYKLKCTVMYVPTSEAAWAEIWKYTWLL